jgi:SAM-dependent methyltransferase
MDKNDELRSIIGRTVLDDSWSGKLPILLKKLTQEVADSSSKVLDIGRSSRENWSLFRKDQIISADINQFDGYPDIILDVCDLSTFPNDQYDAIICHSVLEHTYDPFGAVRNMHMHLQDRGVFLGFTPFLMNYHAPKDLKFQDYYRFTRDGLAYMFRDFSEVTLFTARGRFSSLASLFRPTKKYVSSSGDEYVSQFIDKLFRGNQLQTTGYVIYARK